MALIVPTVTATEPHEFREYMEKLGTFAQRVHIDLMDGVFAPSTSPDVGQVWWPENVIADIHLMYQHPMEQLDALIKLKPSLVVIHAEAEVDHASFAGKLNEAGIRAGLAILSESAVKDYYDLLPGFDHALVFSGKLGFHGGMADMRLLTKVSELREKYPHLEVAWDGGINPQNVRELAINGVQVLNVGGFIANAEDPQNAYQNILNTLQ
jgi:ribulose-phosphate 3-epimerase